MHKLIGLILLGLGAFLLVAAPLLRLYTYPSLAKTPLDQFTENVAEGHGMTAFYTSELETKSGLDLFSIRRVRADLQAEKQLGNDVSVFESHVRNVDSAGTLLSSTLQRAAMDRTTGAAIKCDCQTWAAETDKPEDRKELTYQGQVFKMPFNAQKKTYAWWDQTLEAAVPAKFVRTEKVDGTEAYVYQMHIEPTTVRTQEVPAKLIGGTDTVNVSVDRVYENTRTIWVEPNTGGVIKGQEELNVRFERGGQDVLTLQKGTITYDSATVKRNAADYKKDGDKLKLIRFTLPVSLAILGVLCLLVGALLVMSSRQAAPAGRGR